MTKTQEESARIKFGEALKKAREKENLSQVEVAGKTDMTSTYYAMIERGEANPALSKVRKLKKFLKINPSDIF